MLSFERVILKKSSALENIVKTELCNKNERGFTMKRMISMLLIVCLLVAMLFSLTACAKGECDYCGMTEKLNKVNIPGVEGRYCDDCTRMVKLIYGGA